MEKSKKLPNAVVTHPRKTATSNDGQVVREPKMTALILSTLLLSISIPSHADENIFHSEPITGTKAEKMIIEGTVINSFSKEVQYGVKYYYSVLYFGYTWLCEQATYRITCYFQH